MHDVIASGRTSRITSIYNEHGGVIGSPMFTSELRDESLFQNFSQARVARHMRVLGLRCKYAKKFVHTTDFSHSELVAPNLLDRNFATLTCNTTWVQTLRTSRLAESGII